PAVERLIARLARHAEAGFRVAPQAGVQSALPVARALRNADLLLLVAAFPGLAVVVVFTGRDRSAAVAASTAATASRITSGATGVRRWLLVVIAVVATTAADEGGERRDQQGDHRHGPDPAKRSHTYSSRRSADAPGAVWNPEEHAMAGRAIQYPDPSARPRSGTGRGGSASSGEPA